MKFLPSEEGPRIEVAPQPAHLDDILSIYLRGFAPNQTITLHASLGDERGRTWTSVATFVVDTQGCVDLTSTSPVSGSYNGVDPMSLWWSATTLKSRRGTFLKRGSEPLVMELTAEGDGIVIASTRIQRNIVDPHVERMPVRERGLVGTFFRPRTLSARPALVVFGGAEGGLYEGRAALLASWGYPALALAYFGMEHLPPELAAIPFAYFEAALTWLGEQEGVNRECLAIMGTSRGGEAALLLSATLSRIRAVIAVVPSGLVWESESEAGYQPAWMDDGKGVPCLRWPSGSPTAEVDEAEMRAYLAANPEAVEQASIAVEHIRCPVLLICGTDDRIWPTRYFCERIMARLTRVRHPFPFQQIAYEDAGHLFTLPHLPTTLVWHGGSAAAMAEANADYWRRVRAFLDATFAFPS